MMDKILIVVVGIFLLGTSQARGPPGSCDPNAPPANCPVHDPEGPAIHLPHQSDCNQFYHCDWGVAYLKKCPGILHFNPVLEVCDYPEDAGCQCETGTTAAPTAAPTDAPTDAPTAAPTDAPTAAPTDVPTAAPTAAPTSAPPTCNPSAGKPTCPEHDPKAPAVHLPHENDCTKFYECDWGVAYLLSCPSGLHFNPTLQVCDWPVDAGCACAGIATTAAPTAAPTDAPTDAPTAAPTDAPTAAPTDAPTAAPTSAPPTCNPSAGKPTCPEHDPTGLAVHLPHENDCTKFYECDWGVAYLLSCPSGLHFNPTLQVCDWPVDAGCACAGIATTAAPTAAPTDAPTDAPTAAPTDAPTAAPTAAPTSAPPTCNPSAGKPTCPEHDPKAPAVHLPHENDCTKFYECDWGVAYLLSCPSGLHFNPTLQVCDWPVDAGCACAGIATTAAPTAAPTDAQTDAPTAAPTEAPTAAPTAAPTSAPPTCNPSAGKPTCPEHDPTGLAVHLPHENDCTKFYECDWGVAYLLSCPSGLHFNPTLQVCDWPVDAGCACAGIATTAAPTAEPTDAPTDAPTAAPTDAPTAAPTSAPPTCNPSAGKPTCPEHDPTGLAVHLPHENDCTKFYECDWGVAYLLSCPSGLHFNPTLQVCDWPVDAGCACAGIATTAAPTAAPTDAPTDAPTAAPTDAPTAAPTDAPTAAPTSSPPTCNPSAGKPTCPEHDPTGLAVHLPHENDCTKFYECDWGVAYLLNCPSGLHFNPTLQVCDWPVDAGCACAGIATTAAPTAAPTDAQTDAPTAAPTEAPTAAPTAAPTSAPPTCNPSAGKPTCPEHDPTGLAVHLPHENDCTKFYECDWGVAYLLSCPSGLHFNPTLQVCDWPVDAGCACAGIATTAAPTAAPTDAPTDAPTAAPTDAPTAAPTDAPTAAPTAAPTSAPPTCNPSAGKPTCPEHDPKAPAVHLPHENDCTKFYECDWGVAYLLSCPSGLHFNPTLQVCDWPVDAGCACAGIATTAAPTAAPTDAPTDAPTAAPTDAPTAAPTDAPTAAPTSAPPTCNPSAGKPTCPEHDPTGLAVHLPHENDCTKFYECDWGVAYLLSCPSGLHFNPTLQVCDWPVDAGCACAGIATTAAPTAAPTDAPTDAPTAAPTDAPTAAPTDAPTAAPTSAPPTCNPSAGKPTCPEHDPTGLAVHLPHENDCTKFYECDWGVAYLLSCPSGLHFNPTLQVCDWPVDAGCACAGIATTAAPTAAPTDAPTDAPTAAPTDAPTAAPTAAPTSAPPTCNPSAGKPTCPEHDPTGLAVHLPHENDCTKFYECDWGVAYLLSCPSGLHFNPTLQVCDWPVDAGCACAGIATTAAPTAEPTDAPTDAPTAAPTDAPTAAPTSAPPTCNPSAGKPTCPEHDPTGLAVHLPHENDCTKFYECDWGVAYLLSCPSGLHFNPTLQVCDWPMDAGCACAGIATTAAPTAAPTDAPTDAPTAAPTDAPTAAPTDAPTAAPTSSPPTCNPSAGKPTCPEHDPTGLAVHLPHENDCTKFYECDWGVAYLLNCPSGLHFNPTLQVCDWPVDAGCACAGIATTAAPTAAPTDAQTDAPTAAPTEAPTAAPTAAPTSAPPTCNPSAGKPTCPEHDPTGLAVHLPHENDCTKFYECDWGVAYLLSCPSGLHFNPTLQVCDWPVDAGCACAGIATTAAPTAAPTDAPTDAPTAAPTDAPTAAPTDAPTAAPTAAPTSAPPTCNPSAGKPTCPEHDPKAPAVHLPHENDCTKFYECDWGVAYLLSCPSGLHFNPTLQVCDWPVDAGCACAGIATTAAPTAAPTDAPTDAPTAAPTDAPTAAPTDAPTAAPTSAPPTCNPSAGKPTCPEHDPTGLAVHLPHENDCTKFYECDWGVAYLLSCPSGLHFNPTLQVCDWPVDAGCACAGIATTAAPTAAPTDAPTDAPTAAPTDAPTAAPTDAPTAAPTSSPPTCNPSAGKPTCPEHDPTGLAVHLPHENDCTKFYECDWGVAYLLSCPSGLHFNPTLQVCDWPVDAGCACAGIATTAAPTAAPTDAPTDAPTAAPTDAPTAAPTAAPTSAPPTCNPSSGKPTCPEHDPTGLAIHLPHENDCTKFYECDWGVAYLLSCPSGLHFNPTLQVCDWPVDAGCACAGIATTAAPTAAPTDAPTDAPTAAPTDAPTAAPTTAPTSAPPTCNPSAGKPTCPEHDPTGLAVHLPHENDCTKFYECDWGVAYLLSCPSGLHFNPTLQVCDWPVDAGCACAGIATTAAPTAAPTDAPTDAPTAAPTDAPTAAPTDAPTAAPTSSPPTCNPSAGKPTCPEHDPTGLAVHLPHENDCTKFYECDWGVAYLLSCPSGLHFNPTLQVCDWPVDAGCACAGIATTAAPTAAPTDSPTDAPTAAPTDAPTAAPTTAPTSAPPTCNPSAGKPTCPEHDPTGLAVHLPHENDCTKFYECDWGVAYLLSCPSGLHFNPTLQVCDWPVDAGCACAGIATTASPTAAPTNAPTDAPTAAPTDAPTAAPTDAPTAAPTSAPPACNPSAGPPTCPEHDPTGLAVHLPHENDCTKFYECDWGVAYLLSCPSGLYFNPTLQVCDWPVDAGCACAGIAPTAGPSSPSTEAPSTAPTTAPLTCDPYSQPPSCPEHNPEGLAVHLPHENDCTKFYECDWGVLHLFNCPDGLQFNPTLQVCDWPENAGCACVGISSPPPSTCNPSAGPPTCPEHDPTGLAVHLPHENDCTKFYECDWGEAYLLSCPGGLYFNPVLQVCDWPEDAGCNCA